MENKQALLGAHMNPTIGRIVHCIAYEGAKPQAAIIANVYPDTPPGGGPEFELLVLAGFGHGGSPFIASAIPLGGDTYPQAVWPPRE